MKVYYKITIVFKDGDRMEVLAPQRLGDMCLNEMLKDFSFVKEVITTEVYDMRSNDGE